MNIIFATKEEADQLNGRYIALELDTIITNDNKTTAWCVLTAEDINPTDMMNIDRYVELHNGLIRNYKKQDFQTCINIIEHLKGSFGGNLDSFYETIEQRITSWDDNDITQ